MWPWGELRRQASEIWRAGRGSDRRGPTPVPYPPRSPRQLFPIKPQRCRRPEENEVPRRVAEGAVDGQDRDLECLARLGVVSQLDLVGGVEAADGATAALAEGRINPPVDPDFAVIVHGGAKPD